MEPSLMLFLAAIVFGLGFALGSAARAHQAVSQVRDRLFVQAQSVPHFS